MDESLVENALIYSIRKLLTVTDPIWLSRHGCCFTIVEYHKAFMLLQPAERLSMPGLVLLSSAFLSIKIDVPVTWLFSLGIPVTILILRALISSN